MNELMRELSRISDEELLKELINRNREYELPKGPVKTTFADGSTRDLLLDCCSFTVPVGKDDSVTFVIPIETRFSLICGEYNGCHLPTNESQFFPNNNLAACQGIDIL